MQLTEEERHKIVFEYENLGSIRAVVNKLHYNRKTVRKWVNKAHGGEKLVSESGGGRPQALSTTGAKTAMDMLLSGKYASAKEVAEALTKQGLVQAKEVPHPTTIIRHAKAAAMKLGEPIKAVSGKPTKQLTEDTKKKRLQFVNDNTSTTWGNVMFTDRKKFYFRYPGTRVRRCQWVRKGQKRVAYSPSKPSGLNIYAGITKFGVTKPHIVSGTTGHKSTYKNKKGQAAKNITTSEYQHVVEKTLLPEGRRLFSSKGMSTWVLQQDNDPTHKKASQIAVGLWNKKHPGATVKLIKFWPPNSPDLSPIENVWAWVQTKVDKAGCQTFKEFKACVFETLKNVPRRMLNNLFRSMKDRLKECKAKKGEKTKY
jgi:transposase